jgi:hypothetical protein
MSTTSARNARPELAGLKSVWVLVSSDNIVGLDDAPLKSEVEAHLRKAGLQAEQERGSRTLFLRITYGNSQECPEAVFLRVSASLSERVRLPRNMKVADVRAATWEETELAVVAASDVASEAQHRVLRLVDSFADSVVYSTSVYAKPAVGKQ